MPSSSLKMPFPSPAAVVKVNQAWIGSDLPPDASVTRQPDGFAAASVASSIAPMAGFPSIVFTFQVKATRSRQ